MPEHPVEGIIGTIALWIRGTDQTKDRSSQGVGQMQRAGVAPQKQASTP